MMMGTDMLEGVIVLGLVAGALMFSFFRSGRKNNKSDDTATAKTALELTSPQRMMRQYGVVVAIVIVSVVVGMFLVAFSDLEIPASLWVGVFVCLVLMIFVLRGTWKVLPALGIIALPLVWLSPGIDRSFTWFGRGVNDGNWVSTGTMQRQMSDNGCPAAQHLLVNSTEWVGVTPHPTRWRCDWRWRRASEPAGDLEIRINRDNSTRRGLPPGDVVTYSTPIAIAEFRLKRDEDLPVEMTVYFIRARR